MKRTIISIGVFALLAAAYGFYLYFKEPVDTRQEDPDYVLSASELAKAYSLNEDSANTKFVDKIILVSGEVSELQINGAEGTLFLSSGDALVSITCSFYSNEVASLKDIKKGDRVRIKGKCTGKLMDIILNNCSIVTN